jgi:hypothetical protein
MDAEWTSAPRYSPRQAALDSHQARLAQARLDTIADDVLHRDMLIRRTARLAESKRALDKAPWRSRALARAARRPRSPRVVPPWRQGALWSAPWRQQHPEWSAVDLAGVFSGDEASLCMDEEEGREEEEDRVEADEGMEGEGVEGMEGEGEEEEGRVEADEADDLPLPSSARFGGQ